MFNNTVADMRDCINSLEEPLSPEEHRARCAFIRMCADVVFEIADKDNVSDLMKWAMDLPVDR
jgi:hypothetical protein